MWLLLCSSINTISWKLFDQLRKHHFEVLAKIIIDSFQLRSVDLAAVLTMAECMLEAQEAGNIRYDSCQCWYWPSVMWCMAQGEEVVVVLYAGGSTGTRWILWISSRKKDDSMAKAQILPFWNEQFGCKEFFSNQLWDQSWDLPEWGHFGHLPGILVETFAKDCFMGPFWWINGCSICGKGDSK